LIGMSLRIACDLDGTVADMDAALQREAERLFGPEVELNAGSRRLESAEDVEAPVQDSADAVAPMADGRRPLTPREIRQLWRHVATIENFWMSLGEIEPGAVASLAAKAQLHRWEIIFLTQRPPSAGAITQVQSQRWLAAHGFEWPSVMVMRGSRGKVAAALSLDVVIDDRPENCLDVTTDSQAMPLLIWRFGMARVPADIAGLPFPSFSTMAAALAHLEKMTATPARTETVFGRLRRAFGGTP
jgi:hypothetical protein